MHDGSSRSIARGFEYSLSYVEREKLLSISPKEDLEDLRKKLKGEIQEQNKQLQAMVNSLVTENKDLKQRISSTEQKLAELEKAVHEFLE